MVTVVIISAVTAISLSYDCLGVVLELNVSVIDYEIQEHTISILVHFRINIRNIAFIL